MKFQLKNNSYLLMLMMLLAFVGDALSAERGADRPGVGSTAAAAAAGAEEAVGTEEVEKPIFTLSPGHGVIIATLSLDGSKLVTLGVQGTVELWNVEDGKSKELDHGGEAVSLVRFSPDGSRLVTLGLRGAVQLWNVEDGKSIKKLVTTFKDVTFSSDSSYLATISERGEVKIWNAENGDLVRELDLKIVPFSVAFSPDGSKLVTVERGIGIPTKIWNAENGELIQEFDFEVSSVKFSLDGRLVATVSKNGEVKIWNTENGELIRKLRYHGDDQANSAVFSPDGSHVIAVSLKSTVRIWNIATGKLLKTNRYRDPHRVQDAVFSTDGRLLAMLLDNGKVTVYEVSTLNKVKVFRPEKQVDRFLVFSPDGRFLVTMARDDTIQVWRIYSRRLTKPAIAKISIKDTSEGKFLQSQITAALSKDGAQQIKDHYKNLKKAIENNEVENEMPEAFDDLYARAIQFLKDEEC